jgi:hypothetical protein
VNTEACILRNRAMRVVGALICIAALGGCASLGLSSAPSDGNVSITNRISNLFGSSSTANAQAAATPLADEIECPTVDVRTGASTITVYGQGEQNSTNVRYQATIGQMARECAVRGTSITMKVGVQGRIILGPAGGAGQLDVPIRIAMVEEGPQPKTIWTKLYQVPVQIPGTAGNVTFVHVENDLTVPRASVTDLESTIVYVGFDQNTPVEKRPRGRTQPRGR